MNISTEINKSVAVASFLSPLQGLRQGSWGDEPVVLRPWGRPSWEDPSFGDCGSGCSARTPPEQGSAERCLRNNREMKARERNPQRESDPSLAEPPKLPKITPFCKGPPLTSIQNFSPWGGMAPLAVPLSDGLGESAKYQYFRTSGPITLS